MFFGELNLNLLSLAYIMPPLSIAQSNAAKDSCGMLKEWEQHSILYFWRITKNYLDKSKIVTGES